MITLGDVNWKRMNQNLSLEIVDWLQVSHFTSWFSLIQESWHTILCQGSEDFQLVIT
jgi:hypothetical protein